MAKLDQELAQIRAELDALKEALAKAGFPVPPQSAPQLEREEEE